MIIIIKEHIMIRFLVIWIYIFSVCDVHQTEFDFIWRHKSIT